ELRRILEKAGGFPMISKHWDEREYNWVDAYIYTDTKVKHIHPFFEHHVQQYSWKEESPYYLEVPWLKILKTVFKTVDIDIDENERVILNNPYYLKRIGELLNNQTKRTLANYIGWKIIYKFGAKAIYEFQKQDVNEFDDDISLKMLCYYTTEKVFHEALSYLYVKKYLKDEGIEDLSGFLHQLKSSLNHSLQQADWMDDETRSKAQLKLEKMVGNLGNFMPANIYTIEQLDKAFERFHNLFLALMIGILQPPLYYQKAPLATNFGGIAWIIGHEITHGFDQTGSQYDYNGEKNNWWDQDTLKIYKEKTQCFIDQYSNVTEPVTGKKVNGTITVGDNVADNGGLRLAFDAFKEYARTKHPEKNFKLPFEMSEFSTEQLFFISVANLQCHNYDNKTISVLLKHDSHSPNSVRVNVPMQNSENFAKAFNCKPGSPMNPENKCLLW
ncbi:hypothetical protein B4U79_14606, partial [Dinothrombium tinctorium]